MEELRIEPGKNTPDIVLNPSGFIRISGRSIHENAEEFYDPVVKWVNNYVKNPADQMVIDINMEYFNSASARVLVRIFKNIVNSAIGKSKKVIFNWYYEEGDEDILERGEYFSSVLSVPFNFIKTGGFR